MPKYAAKVDGNHAEIVAALRKAGCTVTSLAPLGRGCPDVLVGRGANNYLLEIKMHSGRLTPDELAWQRDWRGQVAIVFNVDQALAAVGAL